MNQTSTEKRGFPPNMVRLCIDSFDKDMKGKVYTKLAEKPLLFKNCGELFLKTDVFLDQCGYPQTFQEKRKFSPGKILGRYAVPKVFLEDEIIREQKGKLCTIDILIQSRRRAGWQGLILPEKGQETMPFQGELELLKYIRQKLSDRECQTLEVETAFAAESE